jgi:predicted nucleic acid binding AN1-type Zn finger protein
MYWQTKANKVTCKNRAISTCSLCKSIFCIQHRFEDQHECVFLAVEHEEEEKKTDQKQQLMAKIKARNEETAVKSF